MKKQCFLPPFVLLFIALALAQSFLQVLPPHQNPAGPLPVSLIKRHSDGVKDVLELLDCHDVGVNSFRGEGLVAW